MIELNNEDLMIKTSGPGEPVRTRITHVPSGISGEGWHMVSAVAAREMALADLKFRLVASEALVVARGEPAHDSDVDFSVWLGTDFKDRQLDHIATIEGFLKAAFRAGWKAGREDMIQSAMEEGGE